MSVFWHGLVIIIRVLIIDVHDVSHGFPNVSACNPQNNSGVMCE